MTALTNEEKEQITSFYPKKRLKTQMGSRVSVRLKPKTLVHDEIYKRATREGRFRYGKPLPKVQRERKDSTLSNPARKSSDKDLSFMSRHRPSVGISCIVKSWSIEILNKGSYLLVIAENLDNDECMSESCKDMGQAQAVYSKIRKRCATI